MKKRNKIIITMLMVITMLFVMAVSTFASGNVLKGEHAESTVDTTNIIGTWVFNNSIPITETIVIPITFISNNKDYTSLHVRISNLNTEVIEYITPNLTEVAYEDGWRENYYKTIEIKDYDNSNNTLERDLAFLIANATKIAPIVPGESTVGILDVASEIPSFLVNVFVPLISIFYADGAFTIIGVLSLAAFAFFLILLLFQVIKRFVQFRG